MRVLMWCWVTNVVIILCTYKVTNVYITYIDVLFAGLSCGVCVFIRIDVSRLVSRLVLHCYCR